MRSLTGSSTSCTTKATQIETFSQTIKNLFREGIPPKSSFASYLLSREQPLLNDPVFLQNISIFAYTPPYFLSVGYGTRTSSVQLNGP